MIASGRVALPAGSPTTTSQGVPPSGSARNLGGRVEFLAHHGWGHECQGRGELHLRKLAQTSRFGLEFVGRCRCPQGVVQPRIGEPLFLGARSLIRVLPFGVRLRRKSVSVHQPMVSSCRARPFGTFVPIWGLKRAASIRGILVSGHVRRSCGGRPAAGERPRRVGTRAVG